MRLKILRSPIFFACILVQLTGCAGPVHGPDKQFSGSLTGAATGAGAGAVTGFQVGSGTGPGAAVGAGVGAVVGGIRGAVQDSLEEEMITVAASSRNERELAVAHEILNDQMDRRLELHPTREIYPADLFFAGDHSNLRSDAEVLVRELAKLNRNRVPWSRLVIANYVKSSDTGEEDSFAEKLAQKRPKELFNCFVRAGIEARRLEARGVAIDAPVLIDPKDDPLRYSQAVELIVLDR